MYYFVAFMYVDLYYGLHVKVDLIYCNFDLFIKFVTVISPSTVFLAQSVDRVFVYTVIIQFVFRVDLPVRMSCVGGGACLSFSRHLARVQGTIASPTKKGQQAPLRLQTLTQAGHK